MSMACGILDLSTQDGRKCLAQTAGRATSPLVTCEWRYLQTGDELADYFSPDLDISNWHTMDIPQNWYLAGLNYHDVIWFRREFEASAKWHGCAAQLRFDGVDDFADVWLNGERLGHHEGYFQPFTLQVWLYGKQ